ncbi:hypothetical protein PK35_11545 [Tamlana nanhaiensis]|uniref:Uncharacterized protein n=1 Tax=Neotamlana nanhaiensis TaxID=1382798 RepID=A0A0D7W2I7_9FLAO|nr:hypothetical protein [Tamlana nanhaiensis]KJD32067.1 hypothetical protein PK35_10660 [Tamlana nanhaiensis]KJD32229.1 hypothetical protein PK35_11545 [Tamlana nanhaiensis]
MKIKITLTFLLLSLYVNAQYNDWTKATVHLMNNEIFDGHARLAMLNAKELFSSKEKLRFVNFEIKQRTSTKFSPEEVEKIVFEVSEKIKGRRIKRKAVFVPVIKEITKKKKILGFAEIVIDGKVKLFKRTVYGQNKIYEESLIAKEGEAVIPFNYIELKSFKNRASEYFKDCPNLVSKLENKKYRRNDLEEIVTFYNSNCAK